MKWTHTPPATPPATRDLQMLRSSWVGGLTPSSEAIAEAVRDRWILLLRERKVNGITEIQMESKSYYYICARVHTTCHLWRPNSSLLFFNFFGDSFVKQRTTAWSRLRDESISHLVRISYYSLRHVLFLKSLRNLTCSFNYLNQNLFFTLKTDKHIHQVRMHYKWFMSLFHVTCKQCLFSCFDFETVLYI